MGAILKPSPRKLSYKAVTVLYHSPFIGTCRYSPENLLYRRISPWLRQSIPIHILSVLNLFHLVYILDNVVAYFCHLNATYFSLYHVKIQDLMTDKLFTVLRPARASFTHIKT
jgi:hypothetical protein